MFLSSKKIIKRWHYIGLFILLFGLLRYFFDYDLSKNSNMWDFFWVCHITSVLAGIIILSRDKFLISGVLVWIILGPLLAILFNINGVLSLTGFHHITTALALPVILFYYKETWSSEGFAFGVISFYAYMSITANLSDGAINLLNNMPLWVGLFLAMVSLLMIFQNKFLKYQI